MGTATVIQSRQIKSGVWLPIGGGTLTGDLTLSAHNLVTDTTTGTQIATAASQKLGFFGATPVIQEVAATDLGTVLSDLGLRAAGAAYPITTSGAVQFTGGVTITATGLTITDVNVALSATTGTKIGTATSQKLGFFNATPVIQPVAGTDLGTVLSSLGLRAAGTAYPITTSGAVQFTGGVTITTTNLTLTDKDIVLGTTTGTKIGTATSQKLGFFNATPVIQPVAGTDLGTVLSSLGLRAAGTAYPITTSGAVQFTGGVTITTTNLTLTDKDVVLGTTTGTKFGTATGQKIGFWNVTPVIQPAGATQVAMAAYATGTYGLDTNAHMQALYDLVAAIRTALVACGIMKGAA